MNSKINIIKWAFSKRGFPYLVLCLTLLGMLNAGVLYVYLIFIFCFMVLVAGKFNHYFDNTGLLILLFSLSYVIIPFLMGRSPNLAFSLYFGISPVFFYVYGRLLIDELYKSNSNNWFIDIILGIVLCSTLYIYYSFFVKQGIEIGMVVDERNISLRGDNDEILATAIGNILCFSFIGLSCFFFLKTNPIRRILFLVFFVLSMIVTTFLLNRTGIFLSALVFLVISLYYSKNNYLLTFLYIAIVFFLFSYLVGLDMFQDISSGYTLRNEDLSVGGGRFERWRMGIENLREHPMGWYRNESLLAHNLWLDIGGNSGIIPLIIMLLITIRSIKDVVYAFKKKGSVVTVILLSVYSSLFFSMIGEPFLESVPIYVLIFFMICGCFKQYRRYDCTCI